MIGGLPEALTGLTAGAMMALPFQEAEIGDLRHLPDDGQPEQEAEILEHRQPAPNRGEGIDADVP